MGKSSKSLFIGALASTMFSGVAFAADYIPPPVIDFEPEYELEFGGNLYLRGYVGFTNQEVDRLDNVLFADPARIEFLNSEFESSGLAGFAVGYRFNEWFRFDVSGEYRMRAGYDATDRTDSTTDPRDIWDGTNTYTADKSEFVFLANAYADLGTYHNITPYVGAGIGASYTMITGFTDRGFGNIDPDGAGGLPPVLTNSLAFGGDNGEWSLAWALYAGLGYEVNERLTLDFGYRYLSIGDASTEDLIAFDGTNNTNNPMGFEGITSHDVLFGMRWNLGPVGLGGHGGGFGQLTY